MGIVCPVCLVGRVVLRLIRSPLPECRACTHGVAWLSLLTLGVSLQDSAFRFVDLVLFTLFLVQRSNLCLTSVRLHVLNPLRLFLKLSLLRSSQLLVLRRSGLDPALRRLVGRLAHLLLLFQLHGAFSLHVVSLELRLPFS